ncbi:CYTH and CHAD domain-containing protein [Streptomyces sp. R302]|uniref:CYTH and CHAD domain-containing protein n=1 Tax=unclassified Streptomyces TaxID=2593676 RepID=UPI00145E5A15|nr:MULTISPECIES: CYTH and CHAD domain-containing protein [unclassified Streptomyces]NML49111.1 CYTH and CHAD domain-containing protein [Streptomyces sp. R301]NML77438.1 CYTH and CHAD domain-containing protein [Streptomyces sp. R302]
MAETKREIERKYEATADTRLPDLTRAAGVASVTAEGVTELDAVYYDTAGLRLAADSLTLRRRTGGSDAGWHLKFPVAAGVRDEIRAPLTEALPPSLAGLLRSRVRHAGVIPVVRLRSSRDVRHLRDGHGTILAELSVDTVRADRLLAGGSGDATAAWTEIEVELADDADPAVLDAVEKRLRKAGIHPSDAPSKLARALSETGLEPERPAETDADGTARAAVLAYVREQAEALVRLDPAVRRDLPDAVHQLRVACRRLRSAFKTYRKVLDRDVTDPIGAELKWLAGELGHARDQEVLAARLGDALDGLDREQLHGPVRGRLRTWDRARSTGSRRRALDALDSPRHLALLDALDGLLADPPLRPGARKKAEKVLPKAIRRDYRRLADRIGPALDLAPGHDRDLALHEARKAAKRARYAADAAVPTLGKPAKRFSKRMKSVQSLLGDHQDAVVARGALRDLAAEAEEAGEPSFTWGVLYARQEAAAAARERELPGVWERASAPDLRAALSR